MRLLQRAVGVLIMGARTLQLYAYMQHCDLHQVFKVFSCDPWD